VFAGGHGDPGEVHFREKRRQGGNGSTCAGEDGSGRNGCRTGKQQSIKGRRFKTNMFAWWIQEPAILAGSCPTDQLLRQLYTEGFRIIISLIDEREQAPLYNRSHVIGMGYLRYNIPVPEGRFPTANQIRQFLSILQQEKDRRKIIVHCLSGDKRTGAMAVAYWMSRGMPEADARNEIFLRRNSAVYAGRREIPDIRIREEFAACFNAENNEPAESQEALRMAS